ncbi:uncharacterized protein LOC143245629 [Tachypleus tridentatus]|uniref:uncharacterized protein LOC143245629 n=1 Tax=Tachypleus tridentatus TaxID=6853 RepID=UPI003FD0E3B1
MCWETGLERSHACQKFAKKREHCEWIYCDAMESQGWYREVKRVMKFAIPRIWRELTDHSSSCYFCMVDPFKHRAGKNASAIMYPDPPSSIAPVPHCPELPVPRGGDLLHQMGGGMIFATTYVNCSIWKLVISDYVNLKAVNMQSQSNLVATILQGFHVGLYK